ncbi:MAG: trigger factor [Clostridia bacterium]|nr:trigger factor [Clostridia bacterium]
MKKISLILAAILLLTSFVLAGCSRNNGDADEKDTTVGDVNKDPTADEVDVYEMKSPTYADLDLTQYVKIGPINGLVVPSFTTDVSEDEINKELDALRFEAATEKEVTDRPLANGDTALFDYVGSVDGMEASAGMTDTDATLEIGSGRFIPGFEEGMIGMSVGETRDVHVVFPDPYNNNPDLSGKPATFVVTLKSFTETVYPELDDFFAAAVSDFDTLDELKAQIKADLEEDKRAMGESLQFEEAWAAVMDGSEVIKYPEEIVNDYLENAVASYQSQADYYGFASLEEMLMQYYGMTLDTFNAEMKSYAEAACHEEIVLMLVAKEAGIVLMSDEYQAGALKIATEAGMYSVEMLEEYYGKDAIYNSLVYEKVLDYLVANAVIE